jgi:O-antigen ligase
MSLFVVCDAAARGLMSLALKVPPKNAAAYNIPDLAVTYVVYRVLRSQLLQMRPRRMSLMGAHFYVEIFSALGARVAGIAAGYFISRALGCPVKPRAITGLIAASTMAICLGILYLPNPPPRAAKR